MVEVSAGATVALGSGRRWLHSSPSYLALRLGLPRLGGGPHVMTRKNLIFTALVALGVVVGYQHFQGRTGRA